MGIKVVEVKLSGMNRQDAYKSYHKSTLSFSYMQVISFHDKNCYKLNLYLFESEAYERGKGGRRERGRSVKGSLMMRNLPCVSTPVDMLLLVYRSIPSDCVACILVVWRASLCLAHLGYVRTKSVCTCSRYSSKISSTGRPKFRI